MDQTSGDHRRLGIFVGFTLIYVVEIMAELQAKVPDPSQEWGKYNHTYLGGAALDIFGSLSNF